MSSSPALLLSFGVFCAAVVLLARWLGRTLRATETAFFLLLTLAYFGPGFFSGRTILPADHAMLLAPWSHVGAGERYNANLNDGATQLAPWAKAVRMAWKEGSLPLRNRWNGAGMALAVNGASAAFSPFMFLMLPFALWAGFNVQVAVKVFLALTGNFLWLRELGLSRGAAAFGAVTFALSFVMAPWLLFPQSAVICLLPWALFAIELARDPSRRRRATILLGVVFFAWPLCGHPESVVIAALFTGIWLAVRFVFGDLPDARRLALRLAVVALVALGLSTFLMIPEAIAIGASNRIRVAEAFRNALPSSVAPHLPYWPNGLLTALFPRTLGDAVDSPMIFGGAGPFPEMALGHFGLIGAAVALLVLRPGSARRKAELTLLVPLLLGLAAATGTWPVFEAAVRIPGLRLMFVLRYFSWMTFAGSAIAAFEIDRLARDVPSMRRAPLALFLTSLALGGLAIWTHHRFAALHAAVAGGPSQKRALILALASLAATGAIALLALARPLAAHLVPATLALLVAGELGIQGARLYGFQDPMRLYPDTPLIAFLRSRPGPFRTVGEGAVLFPNSNVFAGLEDVRTHDAVERKDYVAFLDRAAGYPPLDYFKHIGNFNAPELDLLNVRYLVGEPGWRSPGEKWNPVYQGSDGVVFENSRALERVFDARRIPPDARGLADRAVISSYRERTNAASFHASVREDSRLVVSLVQDGGWSAKNGLDRDIPAGRAEGILLALDLPAGEHDVRLSYCPPGMRAGAAVSAGTGAVLSVLAAAALVRARRHSHPRGAPASRSG